jgi:hypothetical protein
MSDRGHNNQLLNQLLIALYRSLLQYVRDAWPWSGANSQEERNQLVALAEKQRAQCERLINLLYDRRWPVDFGTYPTEYTDLHYVGLGYLLTLLSTDERELLNDVDRAIQGSAGDFDALRLLEEIRREQAAIAGRLEELARSGASQPAT